MAISVMEAVSAIGDGHGSNGINGLTVVVPEFFFLAIEGLRIRESRKQRSDGLLKKDEQVADREPSS